MDITVRLSFSEQAALRLLNWLAQENAHLRRAQPDLPQLYDSGVVYRPEADERWSDWLYTLVQGEEDCDSLAAARAGELQALGWRALREGDGGYAEALRLRPDTLPAEVYLTTQTPRGRTGLYHCLVRYPVGGVWFSDDPSARLGMNGRRIDPRVWQRWSPRVRAGHWRTT